MASSIQQALLEAKERKAAQPAKSTKGDEPVALRPSRRRTTAERQKLQAAAEAAITDIVEEATEFGSEDFTNSIVLGDALDFVERIQEVVDWWMSRNSSVAQDIIAKAVMAMAKAWPLHLDGAINTITSFGIRNTVFSPAGDKVAAAARVGLYVPGERGQRGRHQDFTTSFPGTQGLVVLLRKGLQKRNDGRAAEREEALANLRQGAAPISLSDALEKGRGVEVVFFAPDEHVPDTRNGGTRTLYGGHVRVRVEEDEKVYVVNYVGRCNRIDPLVGSTDLGLPIEALESEVRFGGRLDPTERTALGVLKALILRALDLEERQEERQAQLKKLEARGTISLHECFVGGEDGTVFIKLPRWRTNGKTEGKKVRFVAALIERQSDTFRLVESTPDCANLFTEGAFKFHKPEEAPAPLGSMLKFLKRRASDDEASTEQVSTEDSANASTESVQEG